MKRRLTVLVSQLREAMKAEIKCYQTKPGPEGQTCPSCEFGEQFGDKDKAEGWCRRWDRAVVRSAWCDSWSRSTRLDTPKIAVNTSPKRVKDAPPEAAPASKSPSKGGKAKGGFGGGGGGFKRKAGKVRPPLQQATVGGAKPKAKPFGQAPPEE